MDDAARNYADYTSGIKHCNSSRGVCQQHDMSTGSRCLLFDCADVCFLPLTSVDALWEGPISQRPVDTCMMQPAMSRRWMCIETSGSFISAEAESF